MRGLRKGPRKDPRKDYAANVIENYTGLSLLGGFYRGRVGGSQFSLVDPLRENRVAQIILDNRERVWSSANEQASSFA